MILGSHLYSLGSYIEMLPNPTTVTQQSCIRIKQLQLSYIMYNKAAWGERLHNDTGLR